MARTTAPRVYRVVVALAATSLAVTACGKDFLSGPKLTESPNLPTQATALQQLIAVQAAQFVLQEGELARFTGILTQQIAGIGNQEKTRGAQYQITENDIGNYMSGFYTGGGLVDIRGIETKAHAAGDQQLEGVAKVWEALVMGTATSIWGDIPYSQAISSVTTPILDPQQDVYAHVQAVLDSAIVLLGGTGPGPSAADLIYAGNTARWIRAANTLKARFYMHTFAQVGNPALQSAITAATAGINEAPTTVAQAVHGQAAGDFRAFHENDVTKANIWAQFVSNRQDIAAGAVLVNMLLNRPGDPRLAGYFAAVLGVFRGANQFGNPVGGSPSPINTDTRSLFTYRQPLVTWTENQLILAEANLRLGNPGPAAAALNAARAPLGLAPIGAPTLQNIMEEKYIAMFQTIEVWSDFKRNCYPLLVPGGTANTPAADFPYRAPYAFTERQANPNVKMPTEYGPRNWDTPASCPHG